jgi:carboxypeptidase family protein
MRNVIKLAAALLLIAAVAAPALAQTLTGSINGTVKDSQGAVLPGVTVTLTGRQGSQTQVTDATGQYRFLALEPGTYQISADLSGFQPSRQSNLVITAGRNLEIDLSLQVGGLAENLTVVGESPVVDTKSSATENVISQELLAAAPITRTAINVQNYLPGINSDSAYGGDAGSANALLIDGVDTRDPSGGTAWSFYNYNIVEEFQVQGLGAQAEYGGFTGAVVNTITKSGGNQFTGLFDGLFTSSGLGSRNVPADIAAANPTLADPAKIKKFFDMTTQIGGPLKTNKLFFFISAQRFLQETNPTGPVTKRHEVSPRLNAKLTWQASSNDNITAHLQYDSYNIIGRAGQGALLSTDNLTNREDAPEYLWLTQWRHLFGANTFSEVKYTGWWGFYDLNPEVTDSVHYSDTGAITGGQGWFYYADRGRDQVNASISHYADKFGRHELKFGAEFERSTTRDRYGYSNGIAFYDYGGVPYYAYAYGYDISAVNKRQSVFAQDQWRIGENWTISLGTRGDFLQGSGESGGNVYSSKNWQPRLGFAWDLAGDHRTVVKGSYGWYYEGAQTTLFTQAVPGMQDYVTYLVIDGDTSNLEEIDRNVKSVPYSISDNIKHPRVDEATIAFERALTPEMRLSVTGIWREWKDFVGSVNPAARWTPFAFTDATGKTLTLYRWANRSSSQVGSNYLIENVDGFQYLDPNGNVLGTANPFRNYKGLMFVLNKRYSNRWTAQASYVYSRNRGSINNDGSNTRTRQWETPNLAIVNNEGRPTYDRPHEFKLLASYQVPVIETAISGYFRAISGTNYTAFQRLTSSQLNTSGSSTSYREPFIEPRGSRRLPTVSSIDLRLEKTFTQANNRFGIYMDIENMFNRAIVTGRQARRPSVDVSVPLPDFSGTQSVTLPFETATGLFPARQIRVGGRWSF